MPCPRAELRREVQFARRLRLRRRRDSDKHAANSHMTAATDQRRRTSQISSMTSNMARRRSRICRHGRGIKKRSVGSGQRATERAPNTSTQVCISHCHSSNDLTSTQGDFHFCAWRESQLLGFVIPHGRQTPCEPKITTLDSPDRRRISKQQIPKHTQQIPVHR
jgi:hypothetical protein